MMDPNTSEPDYRNLYFDLLHAQNQAIESLQQAHIQAEEACIGSEPDEEIQ